MQTKENQLSEATPAAKDSRLAAFLTTESDADTHIVDTLIEERCPSFVAHWTWPAVRPILYKMLGYKKARVMADEIAELSTGDDCFDMLGEALELDIRLVNPDRVRATGRSVLISNHPTGLADGSAVWEGLRDVRRDLQIFANADACRVNAAFADVIIPVEWVTEKRSPAKTRETLRRASQAFSEEQCLVIFPSGRLAEKIDGDLVDKGWFPTAVSLARKNKAPVTPMHMRAANSNLYYTLSKLSGELRDITLFYELLNKQKDIFELTFGPEIQPEQLSGDPQAVTDQLKDYVENSLPNDPDKPFEFKS